MHFLIRAILVIRGEKSFSVFSAFSVVKIEFAFVCDLDLGISAPIAALAFVSPQPSAQPALGPKNGFVSGFFAGRATGCVAERVTGLPHSARRNSRRRVTLS